MTKATPAKKLLMVIVVVVAAIYLFGIARPDFNADAQEEPASSLSQVSSQVSSETETTPQRKPLSREEIEARATDTNYFGALLKVIDKREGESSETSVAPTAENIETPANIAESGSVSEPDTGNVAPVASGSYNWTAWDVSANPDYIRVDGSAVISYDISESDGIVYEGCDHLGRAGYAADIITAKDRADAKKRGRQSLGSIKLAGWQSGKTTIEFPDTGKSYHGDFYNRSHLIADSLGGDPVKENLVVGTRTQNVGKNDGKGGMAYTEELARDYLDNGGEWIYYAATPVYNGDEILPRSVYVDMKSDDGSLDMHVEVYNTAYGHDIDYKSGEWN